MSRLTVACLVGTLAFWAYTRTLLPGVDLGDTGGFQAAVLWPESSARQAYPLYYALARPFVRAVDAGHPAIALNLFSAICGATAVGLLVYISAGVTGSLASGALAGVFLAFSYTFWSQAIIAEVYTLHLTLVGLCLLALHRYQEHPSLRRLTLFFIVYAASFGNHLSMILLLVPFAVFLMGVTTQRRMLVTPRVLGLACLIAGLGTLMYLPNVLAVWSSIDAPDSWRERFASFWFDATKADWRESMMLGIGRDQLFDHLAMWWFDARQQFGAAGIGLAALGFVRLSRVSPAWTMMLATAYVFNTAFAVTYNVGDAHVFFLPGHFIASFMAGAAFLPWHHAGGLPARATMAPWARSFLSRERVSQLVAVLVLACGSAYAVWRAWDTWPVVDRHDDRRGARLVNQLTFDLSDRQSLLLTDLNWQLENVLLYQSRFERRDLLWVRLPDVLRHLPYLVDDNHRIGRDVVLTADAADRVAAAYGESLPLVPDDTVPPVSIGSAAAQVPKGAPYVLTWLTPPRDEYMDRAELARIVGALTGGRGPTFSDAPYQVMAGIAAERPSSFHAALRPYRESLRLFDLDLLIRMESWLPSDTFRRAGFGHVLRGRERVQILERGLNLVWFSADGVVHTAYGASLMAPKPRFRIPVSTPRLAASPPPSSGIAAFLP